jgi:hypothetical protein
MLENYRHYCFALLTVLILTAGTYAQQTFEGYSYTVHAGADGAGPLNYLSQNSIQVFLAGTKQQAPAAGLTACDGSNVRTNQVGPNNFGKWCFQGAEEIYDVKLRDGTVYLWYPMTKYSGFYNVKDFRPVTRTGGADGKYVFTEPADYSSTIKNALAFIASRQGGTLQFPDGDYVVGTTDGNTRDPNYDGMTLTSGVIIQGASSNASLPQTDLPIKKTATRIRLRNPNQAIFRIGGATNQVTIRNIELLGNSALLGEAKRDNTGNYGVEAVGKWAVGGLPNSSQVFKFENVTFQNFDKGIYVHNANEGKCDAKSQYCDSWQFDHVLVDHGVFVNNRSGIWIDTFNSDWKITNSVFNYIAREAPGDGIHIQRMGAMLVEQSWGGGYDYGDNIGGTFIYIGTIGSMVIINSGSENGRKSIEFHPYGGVSSANLTIIGGMFDDPIELGGRMNFISSGSYYGARTVKADPGVTITSTGDRFCYDPLVLPGRCKDSAGKPVSDPGFSGGRIMFQTGRAGEGTGANRIEGRPNYFGYNVEIGNGLMQFDPNITFKDITAWAAGGGDRPKLADGAIVYCKDCRRAGNGACSQGTAGTDGGFAKRINGQWRCD